MSWWLGAGLGFLRGGPFGAIVGGVAEHFLGKKTQNKLRNTLPSIYDKGDFITCLVIILTRVGIVNGPLTKNQIGVVHKFFLKNFNFGVEDFKAIDPLIKEVQNKKPNIEKFVEKYQNSCKNNYSLLLLALCYQVALLDKKLCLDAESLLKKIAFLLNISYEQHNKIREKYFLKVLKTPYNILNIPSDASNEEVKTAYRNLISICHPDRVAHKGKNAAEQAHIKFLEVQAAYQELESLRGI
tara:strand:- start:701 stop:1423 length:723 start_codon:yes stop_codon:yes gene_type:complete